jgi:hypothetical protein
MIKYEYKILRGESDSRLNELGKEGWELVTVTIDSDLLETWYFKRVIPEHVIWQYLYNVSNPGILDDWGKRGWELVGFEPETKYAWFKRQFLEGDDPQMPNSLFYGKGEKNNG